ncbi:hypothetical protein GS435_02735 [Rhodococcus hoagii]|nr:hypothetical protein [Prescottella equi]
MSAHLHRPRNQGFHDFIATTPTYTATNGYPETARDAVPLLVAILDKTPRLDGAICATHPNPSGHRICLTCRRENDRIRRENRKAIA